MKASRAVLLPALAAIAAAGAPVSDAPPAPTGLRRRNRRYYDPSTRPFPQRVDRSSPALKKKRPYTNAEYAAIGKAVEKRQRKAERRLRTGQ